MHSPARSQVAQVAQAEGILLVPVLSSANLESLFLDDRKANLPAHAPDKEHNQNILFEGS